MGAAHRATKRETWEVTSACSFCAKNQAQVKKLIAGPDSVYICEACVALCVSCLSDAGIDLPTVVSDGEWEGVGGLRASSGHVVVEVRAPSPE
jgi:hypothetical protein